METTPPLKKEALNPFSDINTRFVRVGFCDDLVKIVLRDIREHPEKYLSKPAIFIGELSPLDYCATSLRAILANSGIGGVGVGTADMINGHGNYFNVDDYLRQRFAEESVSDISLPSTGNSPRLSYPHFLDDETPTKSSFNSEAWDLK